MPREHSSGGLVQRSGKLLVVQVTNLKGERVWSFPKGHLEKGESAEAAALREVEEETGWRCRVLKTMLTVGYRFTRQGRLVDKKVEWFLMEPLKKTGTHDAREVHAVKWISPDQAGKILRYPSDLELLKAWREERYSDTVKGQS